MKAQHIIAKMLGLNSWKEVIDCPEDIEIGYTYKEGEFIAPETEGVIE